MAADARVVRESGWQMVETLCLWTEGEDEPHTGHLLGSLTYTAARRVMPLTEKAGDTGGNQGAVGGAEGEGWWGTMRLSLDLLSQNDSAASEWGCPVGSGIC